MQKAAAFYFRLLRLYIKAVLKYGFNIKPCINKTWETTITDQGLWINLKSGTTKIIT